MDAAYRNDRAARRAVVLGFPVLRGVLSRYALLVLLAPLVMLAGQPASARPVDDVPGPRFAPDRVIVKYRQGVTENAQRTSALAARGFVSRRFPNLSRVMGGELAVVRSTTQSVPQLLARLRANPDVEYAEPDYIQYPSVVLNDPDYGELWGLQNTGQSVAGSIGTAGVDISANPAWDLLATNPTEVVVMVIDTGVDYTHEDLASRMWVNTSEIAGNGIDDDGNGYVDDIYGIDPLDGDSDPMSGGDHGTHVAGTIAAAGNNAIGIAGVNWNPDWNTRIMACRFLGPDGGFTSDAVTCLDYAALMKSRGVNVVATNNSWGGGGSSDALRDAIDPYCTNPAGDPDPTDDILFLAAAGNSSTDNDTTPEYPVSYSCDNIIGVAATDQNDALASFSSYGATTVDVGAPGTLILSAIDGGGDYVPTVGDAYFDDFESASTWTATGAWTLDGASTFSGSLAWNDSPGGNYQNNVEATVTSPVIDLSGLSGSLRFGFHANLDLESGWDYLYPEYSHDGGASWTTAAELTGSTGGYRRYTYAIPLYYRTAAFRARFRIFTDESVVADGAYVDNVGIGAGTGSDGYSYFDGTSMATPHVAGAASVLAAFDPTLTATEIRTALLDTVDPVPALASKTVTGGRINLEAALLAVGAGADVESPSVPTGLSATGISTTAIDLVWVASTDNVGVDHYRVFRDGAAVGTSATTTFSDGGLTADTDYSYTVSAVDAAGNESGQSTAAVGSTYPVDAWPSDDRYYWDTDGDGLADEWENFHFGNLTTATATSDFDGDGYTDLYEFQNGTDAVVAETIRAEAARRLPPIIEELGIPEQMLAGQTYTLTWRVLGYDSGYVNHIVVFDCTGQAAGSCGLTFGGAGKFFEALFQSPVAVTNAAWTYSGEAAQYFDFEVGFTVPATRQDGSAWAAAGTPVAIRFYQKTLVDNAAGKGGISLLVPGGVTDSYYDATGRRVQKLICPAAGCQ